MSPAQYGRAAHTGDGLHEAGHRAMIRPLAKDARFHHRSPPQRLPGFGMTLPPLLQDKAVDHANGAIRQRLTSMSSVDCG